MKRIFHVAAVIAFAAVRCVFAAEPAAESPAIPAPGGVSGIDIGGNVALEKLGGEWVLPQRAGAPVNQAKVRRFVGTLIAGASSPVPAGVEPAAAGLAEGDGLRVTLATDAPNEGGAAEFFLGLRPEGDFDSVYVKMPGSASVSLLGADLRGELGLWENRPGGVPEPSVWLADSVGFDPAAVVGLTATYPDHVITLTRERDGGLWTSAFPAPGGELSQDGVARWIEDLSSFAFTDVADLPDTAEGWRYGIVLTLADGSEIAVRAAPGGAGGDALATVTPYPVAFVLPEWRFALYFNRLGSLFPKAAPHFRLADVLLLDVRHDNGSVKITRNEEGWEPVALPYAAKADRLELLARHLANWRPEDYADAGGSGTNVRARPGFGGTAVEVVLAGGEVRQYRLFGRHPVFPWRYVALDGERVLSVTDAEAGVMFPGFDEILELGSEPEPSAGESAAPITEQNPEPEPEPESQPVEIPAEEPPVSAPPVETPLIEAPARKIVPAEVDFSGSVAEKAALAAPATAP